jgi:hypothetical protein
MLKSVTFNGKQLRRPDPQETIDHQCLAKLEGLDNLDTRDSSVVFIRDGRTLLSQGLKKRYAADRIELKLIVFPDRWINLRSSGMLDGFHDGMWASGGG